MLLGQFLINHLLRKISTPLSLKIKGAYQRLYRFGQRYDIFQISVNTDVPFWVYRYFLYLSIYIYICMYVCVCVCVCVLINIKVYHKIFSQFRTNYSWFQTLISIKRKKKHNIKNRKLKSYHCILRKQIILIS